MPTNRANRVLLIGDLGLDEFLAAKARPKMDPKAQRLVRRVVAETLKPNTWPPYGSNKTSCMEKARDRVCFINTGFLAFRPEVTRASSLLKRLDERLDERVAKQIKVYLADQDLVNHAMSSGPAGEICVHTDWCVSACTRLRALALSPRKMMPTIESAAITT